jgi:hypothetical protein
MRNLRCLNLFFAVVPLAAAMTSSAGTLIDVAFTDASVTSKTGFAATGVTTNDFWNTYVLDSGALPNLKFVDGTGSGAGLTVANAGAANTNGASDPMYGSYLYPVSGGNIAISVTNLNPGAYDLYLYGHGIQSNQNSVFQLNVGSQSYGSEATINGSGWLSSIWQDGVQYVRFTNVSVSTGQTITVTVQPGASATGVISGIQIATVASNTSAAFIITPPQPTNQSVLQFTEVPYTVLAGGALPLAYQWLLNGTAISTGTNSTYTVPLAEPTNAGNYSVIVSNAYGMATSQLATLSVVPAPVANIGPFVNGSFETPVVTNGNDQYLPPGSTWLTGWMVGGTVGQVFVFNAPFAGLSAVDGQQWVVFDSQISPPGGELSQTFSTILGETYLLTYSEAPALYYSYPPSKSLSATVCAADGTFLAGNESLFTPPYATTWSTVRLTFTAKTTGTTLLFTDTSVPAYDTSVALDAVSVVALPTNSPPLIINVSNQTVNVNRGVVVSNYAYSANGPISFALASNAPTGASITTNGIFSWVPTCGQGSSTNLITVWVTDSSIPPLSNSMTFSVSVGECVEVSVGSNVVQAGQSTCVPVSLVSTVGLTNLSFTLAYPSGFLTNWNVTPSNSAVDSAVANTADPAHTQFTFGVQSGQTLQGTSVLGSICLDTLPGASAFVPLTVTNIGAVASNNSPATNFIGQMGRVVVIGSQSLLEASPGTNSSLTLTLYGNPGVSYDLLTTTNLMGSSWSTVGSVTLTDLFQVIGLGSATNQMQFFKAVQP